MNVDYLMLRVGGGPDVRREDERRAPDPSNNVSV